MIKRTEGSFRLTPMINSVIEEELEDFLAINEGEDVHITITDGKFLIEDLRQPSPRQHQPTGIHAEPGVCVICGNFQDESHKHG